VPAAEHALPPAALRVAPDGKPRMRRQGRCCARARPRAGPAAQAPALGREALRERVAAVAGAALERLLERGRRGGLAPLWTALLGEAGARLDCHDAAASAGGAPPGALSRCAWAARVHALHACAAGAHSGHRRARLSCCRPWHACLQWVSGAAWPIACLLTPRACNAGHRRQAGGAGRLNTCMCATVWLGCPVSGERAGRPREGGAHRRCALPAHCWLAWASQGEAPPRRRAGDAADVAASAARAVGLLAQAAEFHRGSRVEDYGPLVAAATRVCARLAPARAPPDAAAAPAAGAGADAAAPGAAPGESEDRRMGSPPEPLMPGAAAAPAAAHALEAPPALSEEVRPPRPSLAGAAARLIAAVVAGHGKAAGASAGMGALAGAAAGWAPALAAAPLRDALALARSLIRPPGGGPAAAALFMTELPGVAARALLGEGPGSGSGPGEGSAPGAPSRAAASAAGGEGVEGGEAPGGPAAGDGSLRDEALGLLVEACAVLRPGVRP